MAFRPVSTFSMASIDIDDQTFMVSTDLEKNQPLNESRMGFSNRDLLSSPAGFRRPFPCDSEKAMKPPSFVISPPKITKKSVTIPDPVPRMELKQFQPKEVLDFKQILVKSSKTLFLDLYNPSINTQSINFAKVPKPGKGFTIIGDENQENVNSVPPKEVVKIGVKFEPEKSDKVCESILITTNEGHRLQVSLIGTAVDPPKKKPASRVGPNRRGTLARSTTQTLHQPTIVHGKRESISRCDTFTKGSLTQIKGKRSSEESGNIRKVIDFHLDLVRDEEERKIKEAKEAAACVKIQCVWRGFSTRKKIEAMLREQAYAVHVISNAWKSYRLRCFIYGKVEETRIKKEREEKALKILTKAWRGYKLRSIIVRRVNDKKERKNSAARKIQKAWKVHLLYLVLNQRIQAKKEEAASRIIQSAWKIFQSRKILNHLRCEKKEAERREDAAIIIQSFWRAFSTRCKVKLMWEEQTNAVRVIASAWKSYKLRSVISARIEGTRIRKEKEDKAVKILIKCWRGYRIRSAIDTKVIQTKERRNSAALKIQKAWKFYLIKLILEQKIRAERERAAITIQAAWKGFSTRKLIFEEREREEKERKLMEELRLSSCIKIQCHWRGYWTRKKVGLMLEQHTNAVNIISSAWKTYQLRSSIQNRIILTRIRKEQEAKSLQILMKISATTIQAAWRGYWARRLILEERKRVEKQRVSACITIQSHWRGYSARRKIQQILEEQTNSVRVIWTAWRSYQLRSLIQKRIELTRTMKEIRAVHVISSAWKSCQLRSAIHERILKTRTRKEEEKKALEILKARSATRIQTAWKVYLERKRISEEVKKRKEELELCACVKIQSCWRGYSTRKRVEQNLHEQMNSVNVISKAWKSYRLRSCINNRVEKKIRSAIRIQAAWKGYWTRKRIFEENRRVEEARIRISEQIRNSVPAMRLGNRTNLAIEELSRHSVFSRLGAHIDALVVTSKMSPDSCLTISDPLVLYELMKVFNSCCRSYVSCQAVQKMLKLILNMAKLTTARSNIISVEGFLDKTIELAKNHVSSFGEENKILTLTLIYIILKEEKSYRLSPSCARNLLLLMKPLKRNASMKPPKNKAVYRFDPYWSVAIDHPMHFQSLEEGYIAVLDLLRARKPREQVIASTFKELF
jgi:hypothetical protein